MNYQKYITALLYSVQVPIFVWAGFEFGVGNYTFGMVLTAITMCMEVAAVITWINAQTIEISAQEGRLRATKRKTK
jgi:hypothetical protein